MALVQGKQAKLLTSKQAALAVYKQFAPWTPLELGSSLVAWWDPTQGLTMNGSTVSAWKDRAGGLSATQSTASNQPGLAKRNGVQRLTVNGSQYLTMSAQTLPMGKTLTTLCTSAYGTGSGSGAPFICGWGNSTGGARVAYQISSGDAVASSGGYDIDTGVSYVNQDHFMVLLVDSSTTSVRVDGVAAGSKSINPVSDTNYDKSAIGYWPTYGAKWTGDIGHILAINRVLTTSEAQKMEGWESWTDGKSGANLPSSHPYKSRAPYVSDS